MPDPTDLIAAHTDGAAAALVADLHQLRVARRRQARFDRDGLPRAQSLGYSGAV